MTLKDLKRMMSQQSTHEDEKMQHLKRRLEGRPFYLWGIHKIPFKIKTPYCCFNHIIGLPKKDGKEFPLFNYESMLYRALMEPAYLNSSPSVNKRGDTLEDKREADKRMKAGSEYLHAFKLKQ